jgi:hypothetical protein
MTAFMIAAAQAEPADNPNGVPNAGGTPNTASDQVGDANTGAGSEQLSGPNSEDQGGTGVKGSAQSEGATNKDTTPR